MCDVSFNSFFQFCPNMAFAKWKKSASDYNSHHLSLSNLYQFPSSWKWGLYPQGTTVVCNKTSTEPSFLAARKWSESNRLSRGRSVVNGIVNKKKKGGGWKKVSCRWPNRQRLPFTWAVWKLQIVRIVRITSLYPNFNGSYFGLTTSSIHKMTGLGGNFPYTLTYAHRPHWFLRAPMNFRRRPILCTTYAQCVCVCVWERERETERNRDGSDVTTVALNFSMILHFPLPKVRTSRSTSLKWPCQKFALFAEIGNDFRNYFYTFHCQNFALFFPPLSNGAEQKTKIKHQAAPSSSPSEKYIEFKKSWK